MSNAQRRTREVIRPTVADPTGEIGAPMVVVEIDVHVRLGRLVTFVELVLARFAQAHQRRILRADRHAGAGFAVVHGHARVDPGKVVIGIVHRDVLVPDPNPRPAARGGTWDCRTCNGRQIQPASGQPSGCFCHPTSRSATGIAAGRVRRMEIRCGWPGPGIAPVMTAVTSMGDLLHREGHVLRQGRSYLESCGMS